MLLQFASARLMNDARDRAEGAHVLRSDRARFGWAMLRLAAAQRAPHPRGGALAAGMVPGLPGMAQSPGPDPLPHKAVAPRQELHPGPSPALRVKLCRNPALPRAFPQSLRRVPC